MVLKECYYVEQSDGDCPISHFEFGWYLPDTSDLPACKCIMAVAKGKTIEMNELYKLLTRRTITAEEFHAIRCFDIKAGTIYHLKTIEKLAKKVKVKLVRK